MRLKRAEAIKADIKPWKRDEKRTIERRQSLGAVLHGLIKSPHASVQYHSNRVAKERNYLL